LYGTGVHFPSRRNVRQLADAQGIHRGIYWRATKNCRFENSFDVVRWIEETCDEHRQAVEKKHKARASYRG
jgi:hypothetical protein